MKEIRKRFNIGKNKFSFKKRKKEVSTFTLVEVIVISFAFAVVSSIVTGYVVNFVTKTNILEDKELRDITDTYEMIMSEYYEDVNQADLANAAIDGMMNYLDENYSIHMSGEDTEELESKLKGTYDGIGVEIGKTLKEVVITRVFEGTPADDAGIKAGDVIVDVEGTEITESTTLEEVTSLIKDKKEIILTVLRDGETKSFIVETKSIEIPVVSTAIYEKNDKSIGYLYLETFSDTADNQVRDAIDELESEGIDSLILDLRGNTGGYLTVATDIANMFLKKNKNIYSLEDKDSKQVVVDTTSEYMTIPIVVLINSSTASASEILAAALKESYGAILVGTNSFGKGKVQQTTKLSDETILKYTTAKWFTPSGDSIDGVGLEPGITVTLSDEYFIYLTDEYDDQLQKAISVLAND